MKTRRVRGGFLGIKKAVKSLYQTKKQNKRMYALSRKRKMRRLQEKYLEQKANIENATYK
jgi:hypothetical protein